MNKDIIKLYKLKLIKNKRLVIVALALLVLLIIGSIGYFHYGIGMSPKEKTKRINEVIAQKDYDKARKMNERYYNKDKEDTKLAYNLLRSSIDLCQITDSGNIEEAYAKTPSKKSAKITNVKIINRNYDSNYQDVAVTVENTGDTNISYVKIGLNFKDANGNIVQSDWTNDDSIIQPNSTQTIKKMVSKDFIYDTVQAEILECK